MTQGSQRKQKPSIKGNLVLIEPDPAVRDALQLLLKGESWEVDLAFGCEDLQRLLETGELTAVISESSLHGCTPSEILKRCQARNVPVVFTGHDLSLQGAVDLIRQGAVDFLDKPFPQTRLIDLLEHMKQVQNN